MADKAINELEAAVSVTPADLFVLEQAATPKKLSGAILEAWLLAMADGHGGIADITYTGPDSGSLNGTLTVILADDTEESFPVQNGNGIQSIAISYAIYNNGTDPSAITTWQSSPPAMTDAFPFMWTRIRIMDTLNAVTDAYCVTRKASDPNITVGNVTASPAQYAGADVTNRGTAIAPVLDFDFDLPQGEKGETGDYIIPVVSYGTSTAAATEPTTWYNDPSSISYAAGNFVWRKTEYTLHDAQTVQDTVKEIIGYIGQNGSGAGTVTQITFNGVAYADDGTGNVPMTIDAEDVGAIADPSTKSNGQVLTYDSSADEWVAANPSTGNVNTVNNKGVDAGTTNVTVYASDIKMSSSDSTTIPDAMPQPQASGTPANLGTAARGSATTFSRSDHVHAMPSASDVGAAPSGQGLPSSGTQGQVLMKSSSADYAAGWESLIVESGTSNGWQYWKFADGRVRLRYAATIPSVAITTAAGSVYRCSAFREISYPFLVNDAVANVSVRFDSGTHFPWVGGVVSFQSYVRFMVYNHSSVTAALMIQIEVNGFLPE